MKKKNIIIIGVILVIGIITVIGINMLGKNNPASSQDELLQQEETIPWIVLAELDTYQATLRTPMEEVLNIKINEETGEKTGQFYQTFSGEIIQNNTLSGVMQNQLAMQKFKHDPVIEVFISSALNTYSDLNPDDRATNYYMAINAYFNLLPDLEANIASPNEVLTRAQFMTMIMRADFPVDDTLTVNSDFETAVGESPYNLYAQMLDEDAYLSTLTGTLTEKEYNEAIPRAEAIYMLMHHYYREEFVPFDMNSSDVVFTDVKNDGTIDTMLYKALVFARNKGLIDKDTRWDEGLTKEESLELLIETMHYAIQGDVESEDSTSGG